MRDGETTIETTLQTPEALLNDGLRNLDNILPHFQRRDRIDDAPETPTETRATEEVLGDGQTIHEDTHAVGALERARSFIRDKRRLASVTGIMGAALLTPAIGAQAQEVYDYTGANQEVEAPTPNSYPYANAPLGGVDEYGYKIRECASYARYQVVANGVSPERAIMTYDLDWYRKKGEQLDNNPAPGSIGIRTADMGDGGHVVVVVKVDEKVTYSEYNGHVPNGYYSWSVPKEKASDGTYTYVHLELPKKGGQTSAEGNTSTSKNYFNTIYDKRNKNTISSSRPVREGSHLKSKNDRYKLVVKRGDIKLYDSQNDDSVEWKAKTSKQATELRIETGKGKQRGKNKLAFGSVYLGKKDKDYRKWNIGPATKVEVGNDGVLVGYKGNKRVWVANSIAAVPRAAQQSLSKISSVRQKALGR